MCKYTSNSQHKSDHNKSNFTSVVHNKETLLQKSAETPILPSYNQELIKTYYRVRNLTLADRLESTSLADHKEVNKHIRSLRYCQSAGLYSKDENSNYSLVTQSNSCKSNFCHLCCRAKSTKLSNRLLAALNDPKHKSTFENNYFYFLTLTLKHDQNTRNSNYLKELKSYINKLKRSKIFKDTFSMNDNNSTSGIISSIEMTISKSNYHIHSHILISSPRLTKPINSVQKELSEKWHKITGDSTVISLDLIKTYKDNTKDSNNYELSDELKHAVKEVMKYSAKGGNYNDLNIFDYEKLAQWIIDVKGSNFKNVSGSFRGLGITSCESDYDEYDFPEYDLTDLNVYIDSISKTKRNRPIFHSMHKSQLKDYTSTFKIKGLSKDSINLTNYKDSAINLTQNIHTESELKIFIESQIEMYKDLESYNSVRQDLYNKTDSSDLTTEEIELQAQEYMRNSETNYSNLF